MNRLNSPLRDVFINRANRNPMRLKSIKLSTIIISNMMNKFDKSDHMIHNIKSLKKCIRKQRAFSPSTSKHFKQRLVSPNTRRKIEIKHKISPQI